MKNVYTKLLFFLLAPFLVLVSCEDDTETVRNEPPKVAFSISEDALQNINLDEGTGPRITGTVQSDAGLKRVVVELLKSSETEVLMDVTEFGDPSSRYSNKLFFVDTLPAYTADVTGFRVMAVDEQDRVVDKSLSVSAEGGTAGPVYASFPQERVNANIRPTVNARPAIEGTVSSHWGLESVSYFLVNESEEEAAGQVTEFGTSPTAYNVSVVPDYDRGFEIGMTGFKIVAVDKRGNTSEHTVPVEVLDAAPAPIVLFDQEEVEADLKANPTVEPAVSGSVEAAEGIASVAIYRVVAGQDHQIGETVTSFDDLNNYTFALEPEYEFGMSGIKVVVRDNAGQTVSEVLPVTVIADDPNLVSYTDIDLWATGERSNQPTAFSVNTGEAYVYDQEPVTNEEIARSVHFIAAAPSGSNASYDVFSTHASWLDNNYYKDVTWPHRNTTQLRELEEGELDFGTATSADINALPLGETVDRVRAIQDSPSRTILFETEGGNRGLIYYVGSDEAMNKKDRMTFHVKYVTD